jgi:hypothetical protein
VSAAGSCGRAGWARSAPVGVDAGTGAVDGEEGVGEGGGEGEGGEGWELTMVG